MSLAALVRWLHLYLSMVGFASLFFFSITGLTLNHPDWFGASHESVKEYSGEINREWLGAQDSSDVIATSDSSESSSFDEPGDESESQDEARGVDKLAIAEWLRSQHHLRGTVSEFRADEYECSLSFVGPAYSADVLIDRETARYDVTEISHGFVALINDLHKGRDSGPAWSWVIDITAVLLVISSLTGVWLLLYLKRKRNAGLWTGIIGAVLLLAVYWFAVP